MNTQNTSLTEYTVWDRSVRIFHWVNVVSILCLIAIGVAILNAKALGVSTDGKVLLKTWHVYFGYIFVINLAWRLVWAFIGSEFARWKNILPLGSDYKKQMGHFLAARKENRPAYFLGHNPLARIMVLFLFLLLTTQAVTGLVLAGTDVYMPPFGSAMAEWVSEDKTRADEIKPYSKVNVNEASYKEMRAFRKPFISTHETVFYVLLLAIILHVLGVVYAELKEGNGIVSAMFTGKKVFPEKPMDLD
ncbi:MAG: cytochrome b/b6 domain-containing protein [Gammaproteobacteria bacterium]|nr:cytochrome b/b6 domain-containing protein [Gammaproteobacteria bacterium]MCW8910617.1 cytochrome b/b6 domain-containing protein [Gammaproteobacteria bacterium]MCW9003696.1 cytochrome b/b6 domain-containing protein [Gammaproteobacteria bacterium]MCW9057179.1 cytochrome b/b6 domain-containing protein [Gammaproteobacteria bacterium]